MRRTAMVAALALSLSGAAAAQGESDPAMAAQEQPVLVVSGEGRSASQPDMATLTVGVQGDAGTAGEAIAALDQGMDGVLASLTEAGIASADIQTGSLRLSPIYARDDGRTQPGPQDGPRIEGYRAESLLTVRVRDVSRVGALVDDAVSNGANRLEGVSFGLTEPQAAEDAALSAAVADAMRRAGVIANAAGRTLGEILEITESGTGGGQPVMMRMAADESGGLAVAPGEVETRQGVRLRIALQPE